ICVTLRATSLSPPVPPEKSGNAIGIGLMLPCVTSSRVCAPACHGCQTDAAEAPASSMRRDRRSGRLTTGARSCEPVTVMESDSQTISSAPKHILGVEGDLDVFPQLIILRPQHLERLAGQDRA